MKTVKQDESIARSRFIDCPVCKNHTLKLKRTVQVGRCKSCSESYKIVIVFVKDGKKAKTQTVNPVNQIEKKPEPAPEPALPTFQSPPDSSPIGSSSGPYAGLSEALFGPKTDEKQGEASSGSSQ